MLVLRSGLDIVEAMRSATGYATFTRRVCGYVLDSCVGGLLSAPFLIGMRVTGDSTQNHFDTTAFWAWGVPGWLLVGGLIIFLEGEKGWTPGKRLLHMRVADADHGGPIGWPRALLRRLAFLVSAVPFYIGLLWPIWDSRRQTFHDKIARSVVTAEPAGHSQAQDRP